MPEMHLPAEAVIPANPGAYALVVFPNRDKITSDDPSEATNAREYSIIGWRVNVQDVGDTTANQPLFMRIFDNDEICEIWLAEPRGGFINLVTGKEVRDEEDARRKSIPVLRWEVEANRKELAQRRAAIRKAA